jgi:hypothetical protein
MWSLGFDVACLFPDANTKDTYFTYVHEKFYYNTIHSSVGIATRLRVGDRGSNPGRNRGFFLLHIVQTSTGSHSASYPVGTGGCIPGDKAAGA